MQLTSHKSNDPSTLHPWWCRWCGIDLLSPRGRHYCGATCASHALNDARKRNAPYREVETLRAIVNHERARLRGKP